MFLNKNRPKIINDILLIKNWEDRYEYIINLGKKLPKKEKKIRKKNNIINGCQTKVWLRAYIKDNKIYYHADSDTIISRGIVALLLQGYSGQYPCNIINSTPTFIYRIGFSSFFTSSRVNGMEAMFKAIKKYAIYFQ